MLLLKSLPIISTSLNLGLLIGVVQATNVHDIRYPRSAYHHHKQQRDFNATSFFAITGISVDETWPVPQRLEIRQLQQNTYQWNLYLLAMNEFQSMDQSEISSYYQISGIHGRPFIPWDNVQFAPGGTGGYCTHSSILFPTWHRPYVAVFEQILYGVVQNIAASFTGDSRSSYLTAAATFRVPYWDWAAPAPAGQDILPTSISSSEPVIVDTPNGTQTIPNPLYRYTFNPLDSNQLPDSPVSLSTRD